MRFREYTQDAKTYARHDEWFRTVTLTFLGAVVAWQLPDTYVWIFPAGLFCIMLTLLGRRIVRSYLSHRKTEELLAANREIRLPDTLAERRVLRASEPYPVIGSAVETLIHSTLNTKADYLTMGWDPAHVQIIDTKRTIDPRPILARIEGGLLPLAKNESNDIKFVLSGYFDPLKDDEDNLTLSFDRTDWQTHKTVRNPKNGIETNEDLALEFGNLQVEKNLVPSSVALHYIVRFDDDSVLLLKRGPNVATDPNKWSISCEEQFKIHDFDEGTLVRVFRRALCEEVVGLFDRDPATLEVRWREHVASRIRTMKLWGLVFEERACVTSLLGFYQFGISKNEFVEWHKQLVDSSLGTRDKEGKLYSTTTDELEILLKAGHCKAWPLFEQHPAPVGLQAGDMAKTSRYRAYRLVLAIKGKLPSIGPEGASVLRLS